MQGGTKSDTCAKNEQTIYEAFKSVILTPRSSRSPLVSLLAVLKSKLVFK